MDKILVCTDLDRTLLPNGTQEASAEALPLFRILAAHPQVLLAYVSGRDLRLIQEAIRCHDLPFPDYAVGDVGTAVYRVAGGAWIPDRHWLDSIAVNWPENTPAELVELLSGVRGLSLQEARKQTAFKLSYYITAHRDSSAILTQVQERLSGCPLAVSLVHSVDEVNDLGLLDLLPASAGKLKAVRFLRDKLIVDPARLVYCGDSGNDLEVLTSEIPAVLVANAAPAVRSAVLAARSDTLYLARGDYLGMNGNYAAGVLEGLAAFLPEVMEFLAAAHRGLTG